MALIITALDFSDVALNAVHYACRLATQHNAAVTIVHAYSVPVTFNDNPMPVLPVEESREIAQKNIAGILDTLTVSYPDISINYHITYGDITEALTEYAAKKSPWLIVVGNSLEDDSFWYGSSLLNLMRELSLPVLAIPHGMQYRPVKNICFACDYKNVSEHLPASGIVSFAKATGSSLQVLNIDHDNKSYQADTVIESTALHEMIKDANPKYHFVDNADLDAGIQSFINNNEIDWLIVVPHKHNFLEGLFHKSRTKTIAKHTHIPILALHEK
ncbi:MAG: universal stress protein [Bacteroidetes bacterium]|nr:universal stress protein [Bacteroidota bacterium]